MAREVLDPGEGTRIGVGRAVAAAGVVTLACWLPLLPVLFASGVANGSGLRLAVGASGAVAALLGGGKLAAMAAGLVGGASGAFRKTEPGATN